MLFEEDAVLVSEEEECGYPTLTYTSSPQGNTSDSSKESDASVETCELAGEVPSTTSPEEVKMAGDALSKTCAPDEAEGKVQEQREERDKKKSCPICYEDFSASGGFNRLPILLKCGHSICGECISSENGYEVQRYVNRLFQSTCPHCREVSRFNSCRSLRKDLVMLVSLAEENEKSAARNNDVCSCCGISDAADDKKNKDFMFLCGECNLLMCPRCEKAHQKFPATASHVTLKPAKTSNCALETKEGLSPAMDLKIKLSTEMKNAKNMNLVLPNQCPRHQSIILYRCMTDKELLCSLCFLEEHNGHLVEAITEKFDSSICDAAFEKTFHQADVMLEEMKKIDTQIQESQKKLHDELERVSSEICQKQIDDIHAEIEKIRDKIHGKLSQAFDERMSFLCQKKFELNGLMKNLDLGRKQLQQYYENKQTIQSCLLFDEVSKLIKQVEDTVPTYIGNTGMPLVVIPQQDLSKLKESLQARSLEEYARIPWRQLSRRKRVADPARDLRKDMLIQVLWNGGAWYDAKISAISKDAIRVTYPGWSIKWDEWIPTDSSRIALNDL